jgi:hypothetical protein
MFNGKSFESIKKLREPVVRIENLLKEKNSEIPKEILDLIVDEVRNLLNDTLSRFKETKEFKNLSENGKSKSNITSPIDSKSSDSSERKKPSSSGVSSTCSSVGSLPSAVEVLDEGEMETIL